MSQRQFLFQDGKSDKFWNIEVSGSEYVVNYGRSGTNGQTQTKSFGTIEAAQAAADKAIAEKIKKGYVESGENKNNTVSTVTAAPKTTSEPVQIAKASEAAHSGEAKLTEVVPTPSKLPAVEDVPERTLRLNDADWLWATWRPHAKRPSPTPKLFDKSVAIERLKKLTQSQYRWDWHKAHFKPPFSKEEAYFWLKAYSLEPTYGTRQQNYPVVRMRFILELEKTEFESGITIKEIIDGFGDDRYFDSSFPVASLLFSLYSPSEALKILFQIEERFRQKSRNSYYSVQLTNDSALSLRAQVLPYLESQEGDNLKQTIRERLKSERWPSKIDSPIPIVFSIAAALGMSDSLEAGVESWIETYADTNAYAVLQQKPQEIIFGLGNAEAVNNHMRRLALPLNTPEYIRAWLAHTEFSQLDYIAQSIIDADNTGQRYGTSSKDVVSRLIKTFALAEAPETAPYMLWLMLESKAPREARQWLDEHPLHAIYGLLPTAFGRGKLAETALQYLKSLQKRGYEAHIRAAAQNYSESERAKLEAEVFAETGKQYEPFTNETAPEAVRLALQSDKKLVRQRLDWVNAIDLPPITYGQSRLSDSQVDELLSALRKGDHPLIDAVKSTADQTSLDEFAWQLFQRWLHEGAPSNNKWAMLTLGELGGDQSAVRLAPLVRSWPGESQHQRAVTGLQCLRKIGTDTALMQINGIAQKVKFKGLQAKAVEAMEAIASDRGLSRSQLEDRVIPDCGLDEHGRRIFDFGPRQFRFVLGPDMKPSVREEGGKLAKPRPNLPTPNSKDDHTKAETAIADWKLLKKQISELAKIQVVRLEQAMVKGRRWTLDEFETLLARHPLMTNLVRLLVWEVAAGNRRATFRVTEDGTYADCNDDTFDLAGGEWAHVGIAHPLNIPEEEKRAWGELFSDYEIVSPFTQLGRAIYTLESDEGEKKEITRFKDTKVQPQTLCFTLEKLDWERGPALDGGGFYEHYKFFESSDVTACVVYDPGLFMGGQEYWEPQNVTEIYFVTGLRSKRTNDYWNYPDKKNAVKLSDLDAVALSEVLKDVTEIVAKGEIK